MAEIDNTNPLTPVWPQRRPRRIEDEDKAQEDRSRNKKKRHQQNNNKDKKEKDDGSPHIDEYV